MTLDDVIKAGKHDGKVGGIAQAYRQNPSANIFPSLA